MKGMGMSTIVKFFSEKEGIDSFKEKLLSKSVSIDEVNSYLKKVQLVLMTFRHQLVYDPRNRSLRSLQSFDEQAKLKKLKISSMNNYIGETFSKVKDFVQGKLNIDTMQPRQPSNIDFDKIDRFLKFRPDPKDGRLHNLSVTTVTFANFDLKARKNSESKEDDFDSDNSLPRSLRSSECKKVKQVTSGCYQRRDEFLCKNAISDQQTAELDSQDSSWSFKRTKKC